MGLLHWASVLASWLVGIGIEFQQTQLEQGHAQALVGALAAIGLGLLARWVPSLCATGLACGAAALLGWSHAQWQGATKWHMQWPQALDKQVVVLTGRIDSMPKRQLWGQQFEVAVSSVAHGDQQWRARQDWGFAPGACPDRVMMTWGRAPDTLLPGQTWRWSVQLHAPHGLMNPGGFDAERSMFENGLRAQGKVMDRPSRQSRKPQVVQPMRVSSAHGGDSGQIDRWRVQLAQRIFSQVPAPDMAGLLVGLTVGQQSAISPAHWQTLRNTGIAHLAAISGLHITMMGWLLGLCVGGLWRRSARLLRLASAITVSRWATLAGATAYAVLAGWGIPAQRTVWMLAWVVLLRLGGRRWPMPMVLLFAAVGVTLFDPWALVQASFWLSFAAVGLLMLAGDEALSHTVTGWWPQLCHALKALWRTQWVATLGLAPLSLVFFHTLSVLGFVANLVCIPLFTLVVTPLALLGFFWPAAWQLAELVLQTVMAVLAHWAAHPAALWQGQAVDDWAAGLALVGMAWCLMPLPWRWRCMAGPALLPLLWPTSLSQAWPAPPLGHVQVVAADVGQGTAVLVRTARHALLYDTGPRLSEASDTGLRVLVGLLRAMGVRRLDELMISHGDMDHVGGAASVIANVPVAVLRSSLEPGHPLFDAPGVAGHPMPVTCLAGQHWTWDGVEFEVLYPTKVLSKRERAALGDNAASCVLRVKAQGRQVLITGDAEAPQEAQLVAAYPGKLRSEVLLVPHHGSQTSSTPAFLSAVAPEVAVVQAGQRNRYGHPHPDVMLRYRAMGIAVVQTAACGAWFWQSDHPIQSTLGACWRAKQQHYWHTSHIHQMTNR